ncbi:MAG: phage holin family protein [Saprospiraceae bacterium]|jgi:hypothetical protein|nr:phage holin family protein [Saprospiraceae bacterium]MBL0025780.1 phage holin family protein [Saprospiraceae bacterium]
MKSNESSIELLVESVENYANTNIELSKLKMIHSASKWMSSIATIFIFCILIFFSIAMLSIAASIWIGNYVESLAYGFIFVGGFYFCAAFIFYLVFGAKIKAIFGDLVVSMLSK